MKKTTPESKPLEANDRTLLYALLGGNAISQVGNSITILAGPWFVLQTTGSAAKTGDRLAAWGRQLWSRGKLGCGKTVVSTAGKWEPILRENGSVCRGEVVMWPLDRIQAPSPRLVVRGPSEGAAGPPNCWSQSNRQDDYGIQARSNDCTTGSTGRGCGLWSRCGRSFAWPRRTGAPR